MILLIGEFSGLFKYLVDTSLKGVAIYYICSQFHHHPWNGMHFRDLVQLFFMFIVGVAMPFSFAKRTERGDNYRKLLRHVIQRSFLLFFGMLNNPDNYKRA